jgi:hypothetical protein
MARLAIPLVCPFRCALPVFFVFSPLDAYGQPLKEPRLAALCEAFHASTVQYDLSITLVLVVVCQFLRQYFERWNRGLA